MPLSKNKDCFVGQATQAPEDESHEGVLWFTMIKQCPLPQRIGEDPWFS